MNRKRMMLILLVFVMLLISGIFPWRNKVDTEKGESSKIHDDVTEENEVQEDDMQEENEMPIVSPTADGRDDILDESNNETTDDSEAQPSGPVEEENSEDESENASEDTSAPDDNLDMELPFVPAT